MMHEAKIRALDFEHGCIGSLERDDAPVIQREESVYSDVPPRTKLRLRLTPAAGSNINVELWLPDHAQWNGRFVGLGNGGAAGGINSDRFISHLRAGYAVACTDMGTAPDSDVGIGNPEVWKDFGYRATHLMTSSSKRAIEAFYGSAPSHAYFVGASTGGQQALQEAQRYPDDYDGIVALVPAHCRCPLHAYFLWNSQILQACPFNEEQEQQVIAAANDYYAERALPIYAGRVVADPRCSDDDIEAVIALACQRDGSLSAQHADALRQIFTGPRHSRTGARIFDGVPLGSTFNNACGHLYLLQWVFGKDVDMNGINFHADIERYCQTLGPYLNADDPDLSAFKQRGGKIIMASGSADSIVPYHATLDYYERVIDHFGSLDAAQSFCRFFLLPGKDHGNGGPGINRLPDMLALIAGWCEDDRAPEALTCRREHDGEPEYELSVPAYPASSQMAHGQRGGVGRVDAAFLPAARS